VLSAWGSFCSPFTPDVIDILNSVTLVALYKGRGLFMVSGLCLHLAGRERLAMSV
jgi:hypothetical protein